MGTPTTGTTGIGSPQDDLKNHTRIIRQLKETTEIAQRQRGNPDNSFVNLGELLATGVFRYVNNQLSYIAQNAVATVNASESITGNGSLLTPLTLVNDNGAPGNNYYYGTNASGIKGYWPVTGGGGGSLSVTDGTHTVTGVTALTFVGAVVSGVSPNGTVTITGAGLTYAQASAITSMRV